MGRRPTVQRVCTQRKKLTLLPHVSKETRPFLNCLSWQVQMNITLTITPVHADVCLINNFIGSFFISIDEKSTMRVEIWPNYEAINVDDSLNLLLLQMEINGKESHGIVLRNSNPSVPIISSHTTGVENWRSVDSNDVFAISLEADACQNTNLVGGKGASLAKLARMNRTVNVM